MKITKNTNIKVLSMKRRKLLVISSVLIIFLGVVITTLTGGPTIIRDNRVTDLGTTPVLGRGYSIGTNTFQSTCLTKVILTEPSYDMSYYFEAVKSEGESKTSSSYSRRNSATVSYEASKSWSFMGFGGSVSAKTTSSISRSVRSVTVDGVKYFNHDLFATIDIYSYYASVDEAKSEMSKTAVALLTNEDLPGFFSSCGPYYVRSIGRKARFISRFSYRTMSTTRDTSFDSQLKTRLHGFTTRTSKGWGRRSSSTSSYDYQNQVDQEQKFNSKASNMRLTITSWAFGLGKNEKASLVAFDLETFKKGIQDAFISMQNPRTGKVFSIEVVPWVENTEFQALAKLHYSPDEYENIKNPAGGFEMDDQGKLKKRLKRKIPLYEKKYILNLNAEFFMEIERVDRNLLNIFYKGNLCRKHIDLNWSKNGKLDSKYSTRNLVNHRTGALLSLKDLSKKLTEDYIEQLLKNERKFMYGNESGKTEELEVDKITGEPVPGKGAAACINEILSKGIFRESYRNHKPCRDLMSQMGALQSELVDDYCMPTLK
ncbi:MAG: hypothetical protein GY754_27140 [bacterium]|nr:hypothetical protein [bacterium]